MGIYRDEASYPFDGEGQYSYIISNAYQYGLIARYEEAKSNITGVYAEPWHLRYVGPAHAHYTFEKEHLKIKTYSGDQYEIYYMPVQACSQGLPVPSGMPFTVSGNNIDGFIITVKTFSA